MWGKEYKKSIWIPALAGMTCLVLSMGVHAQESYTPPDLFVDTAPVIEQPAATRKTQAPPKSSPPQIPIPQKQIAAPSAPVVVAPLPPVKKQAVSPPPPPPPPMKPQVVEVGDKPVTPPTLPVPDTQTLLDYPAANDARDVMAAPPARVHTGSPKNSKPKISAQTPPRPPQVPPRDIPIRPTTKISQIPPISSSSTSSLSPSVAPPPKQGKGMVVYSRDPETGEFRQVPAEIAAQKFARIQAPAAPPLPAAAVAIPRPDAASLAAQIPPLDRDLNSGFASLAPTRVEPPAPPSARPIAALASGPRAASPVMSLARLTFAKGLSELNEGLRAELEDRVVKKMRQNRRLRVEIQAFSGELDEAPGSDRRISLARALSVREYLKSRGIDPGRLDIRAMGKNTAETPPDRVDIRPLD